MLALSEKNAIIYTINAPIAQLDRVVDFESKGCRFESCWACFFLSTHFYVTFRIFIMALDQLYQELILEHYRSPHHFGILEQFNANAELENTNCGDIISIQAQIKDDTLQNIKFTGDGCSLAISSASIMTDIVLGKNIEEIKHIAQEILQVLDSHLPAEILDKYGDIHIYASLISHSNRIECVRLPWKVLIQALGQ